MRLGSARNKSDMFLPLSQVVPAVRLQTRFLASWLWIGLCLSGVLAGCTQTEIIESPKTGYAVETDHPKDPELIWTSRTLDQPFDYLGQIKTRAWTYDGALDRLKEAGKQLRADAIIDIHFQRLGFFKTMHAFAIKFKDR